VIEPSNAELQADIARLRQDVQELTQAVAGLVSVWKTGVGLFVLIRSTARFLGYVSVIAGFIYGGWRMFKAALGH
jgi:hypothetical protein